MQIPAGFEDVIVHRMFVESLAQATDPRIRAPDPATLDEDMLRIQQELRPAQAESSDASILMKYYMLVETKAGCQKVSEWVDGYTAADSPALKLAKYYALVNCCEFVDSPADFLEHALADSTCAHLVKCELVSMTKSRVDRLDIQSSHKIRLSRLAESLRDFGATCDSDEQISAACEGIADTLLK